VDIFGVESAKAGQRNEALRTKPFSGYLYVETIPGLKEAATANAYACAPIPAAPETSRGLNLVEESLIAKALLKRSLHAPYFIFALLPASGYV